MKNLMGLVIVFFAVAFFQQSVFAESDESAAIESHRQGDVYQQQGEFKKALFFYQRALTFQPDSAAFCNDVGLMQEYAGQNKDAEQSYLKAISLDSAYLPVYANLGMFYSKLGQYVLAAKYLRQRVDRGRLDDPWTVRAQEELSKVYRKVPALESERIRVEADIFSQKIVEAKKRMERTAERNQTLDFETAYQKGIESIEAGRFDEAVEALETAVVINPRSNEARRALKRAQFGKEKALVEADAQGVKQQIKGRSVSETLDYVSSR